MRPYTYASSAERDARAEARQRAAQAAVAAGRMLRPVEPRDDMRQPGLLRLEVLGAVIEWRLLPSKRNVRQWRAIDAAGVVMVGGVDAILREAAKRVPKVRA